MKKKFTSTEEYFKELEKHKKPLSKIRAFLLETELAETLKWNSPVYTLDKKNVIGLASFKNHFAIWFYNGVFLKDKANALRNAQEGKTKALRSLSYKTSDEIDWDIVKEYIHEAIENQKAGKEWKPKKKKDLAPTDEMKAFFSSDKELKNAFENLSASCKNEYIEYIDSAKKDATKERRMQKIIPMIKSQKGLHDAYKKC